MTYGAFAPHLTVIAPWREWTIRSREDAIAYARKHGIPVDQTKKDLFSRDGNLWHLSHEGGNLEDVWDAPQKDMFKLTVDPLDAPDEPAYVTIGFERGRPGDPERQAPRPVQMIETLNQVAGAHGVGRARPRREPPGRHQVPRRLRDARRHRPPHRAPRARAARARPRHAALQAGRRPCATPSSSTTASGSRPLREALAGFVDETETERHAARSGCGSSRARRRPSAAARRAASTGRTSPRSARAWPTTTHDAEGFIRLFGLPGAGARADSRPRDGGREGGRGDAAGAAARKRRKSEARVSGVTAPTRLPRRGRRPRDQARTPRPRARRRRRALRRGRRLHHQPRAGGAGPRLARAPRLGPRRARSSSTPAARTPAPATPGWPTPARWRRSWLTRLGCAVEEVVVASTGVIGVRLPMEKVRAGIAEAGRHLSRDAGADVARAIMTTDTRPKVVAVAFRVGDATCTVGGMAKGAGMIAPNLATMLAFFTTDATVAARSCAARWWARSARASTASPWTATPRRTTARWRSRAAPRAPPRSRARARATTPSATRSRRRPAGSPGSWCATARA